MKYEVFITSHAETELSDAIEWFLNIDASLAKRFLDEFRAELSLVAKNPLHYQVRYDQVRLFHLKRFPYSVHFQLRTNVIEIIAVYHQRQAYQNLTSD